MSWSRFGPDDLSTPATVENVSGFNICNYQASFFLACLLHWRLASYGGSFETSLEGSQKKISFKASQFLLDIWIQYQLSVMWEKPLRFYLMLKGVQESWSSSGDSTLQCKVSALLYRPYNSADGSITLFYMTLALKLLDQPQERFMKVQGNFTL